MKTQTAFTVVAHAEGKSWLSCATTVVTATAQEAKDKATKILNLTEEHIVKINPVTVYEYGKTITVDNYPYGYLKTTAHFGTEYKKGKGYRSTFQTVNPKNGRLNAVKNSTYSSGVRLICTNDENGHADHIGHLDYNGTDAINKGLYFMQDFKHLLSPEQLKDEAGLIYGMMVVNIKAQVIYCGSKFEDINPLYEAPLKNMKDIMNGEHDNFIGSLLDKAAIDAYKVPDFKPFG